MDERLLRKARNLRAALATDEQVAAAMAEERRLALVEGIVEIHKELDACVNQKFRDGMTRAADIVTGLLK